MVFIRSSKTCNEKKYLKITKKMLLLDRSSDINFVYKEDNRIAKASYISYYDDNDDTDNTDVNNCNFEYNYINDKTYKTSKKYYMKSKENNKEVNRVLFDESDHITFTAQSDNECYVLEYKISLEAFVYKNGIIRKILFNCPDENLIVKLNNKTGVRIGNFLEFEYDSDSISTNFNDEESVEFIGKDTSHILSFRISKQPDVKYIQSEFKKEILAITGNTLNFNRNKIRNINYNITNHPILLGLQDISKRHVLVKEYETHLDVSLLKNLVIKPIKKITELQKINLLPVFIDVLYRFLPLNFYYIHNDMIIYNIRPIMKHIKYFCLLTNDKAPLNVDFIFGLQVNYFDLFNIKDPVNISSLDFSYDSLMNIGKILLIDQKIKTLNSQSKSFLNLKTELALKTTKDIKLINDTERTEMTNRTNKYVLYNNLASIFYKITKPVKNILLILEIESLYDIELKLIVDETAICKPEVSETEVDENRMKKFYRFKFINEKVERCFEIIFQLSNDISMKESKKNKKKLKTLKIKNFQIRYM